MSAQAIDSAASRHAARQQPPSHQKTDEGDNGRGDAQVVAHRVLVVDVAGDATESLATLLRSRRHQVQVAHDGHAALQAWVTFRPEVVLLEINLPGTDGQEVARRLLALPGSKEVLLVALSAFADEADRQLCYEAGFDGHLPKPVEWDFLRQFLAHPKVVKKTTAQP
jgi:two-component system CheB/CheR fusion protein